MERDDFDHELDSESYKAEWRRHQEIQQSFRRCVMFLFFNYSRDQENQPRNFFARVVEDILETNIAIEELAKEGTRNTCRRELRYLIELAVKACYVAQQRSSSSYEQQIEEFERLLNSPNINVVNRLNLQMLGVQRDQFVTDVKRMYGHLSRFVHSSSVQLTEREELAKAGRYLGYRGLPELRELNGEIERVLAAVIVLFMHADLPLWVVGDFLTTLDQTSVLDWHFAQSRYIACIDSVFDYKAERQKGLEGLRRDRGSKIRF